MSSLISTVQMGDLHKNVFPGLKFVYSSGTENEEVRHGLRPTVACYSTKARMRRTLVEDWQHIEMFAHIGEQADDPWEVEDRTLCYDDAYFDDQDLVKFYVRARQVVWGKMLLDRQQRSFVFWFAVYGRKVRLFRLDRAGLIISRSADIVTTDVALQFLYRYNNMDLQKRGWEIHARPARRTEIVLLEGALKAYLKEVKAGALPMAPGLELTGDSKWPKYVIDLVDDSNIKCIVGEKRSVEGSIFGQ